MIIDVFNQDRNSDQSANMQSENNRTRELGSGFHDVFGSEYSSTLMDCKS